jgi:hypothetical protein
MPSPPLGWSRPCVRLALLLAGPRGPVLQPACSFRPGRPPSMASPAPKQSADAQTYLDQLCQGTARIVRAHGLMQAFLAIIAERRSNDLKAWMLEATYRGIGELARFTPVGSKMIRSPSRPGSHARVEQRHDGRRDPSPEAPQGLRLRARRFRILTAMHPAGGIGIAHHT